MRRTLITLITTAALLGAALPANALGGDSLLSPNGLGWNNGLLSPNGLGWNNGLLSPNGLGWNNGLLLCTNNLQVDRQVATTDTKDDDAASVDTKDDDAASVDTKDDDAASVDTKCGA
jgi:hypothetical protein